MEGKIYALVDPITNKVKYIGLTKMDLEIRLHRHIKNACLIKNLDSNVARIIWLKSLINRGLKPKIIKIDSSENLKILREKEVFWIKYYLELENDLTNINLFSSVPYKNIKNTSKEVVKYDLNGNQITIYNSVMQAALDLNDLELNTTIYQICSGKSKKYTCKGFVFRYEGDDFNKFKIVKKGEHKCPEYHKKYLSEKAKERNKNFTREHYVKASSMIKNRRGTPRKKVIEIASGKLFDSIMIASAETGVAKTTISRHCKNTVKKPLFKLQDIVHS